MVRHSLVAYPTDDASSLQRVSFVAEEWLDYVPIRMSETICIQDRLPPGAAAVLINQTHAYKDLFLPIGSTEKRWFDSIDGTRSIAEMIKKTTSSSPRTTDFNLARTFFEHLWWHDQVVFDASRPPVR